MSTMQRRPAFRVSFLKMLGLADRACLADILAGIVMMMIGWLSMNGMNDAHHLPDQEERKLALVVGLIIRTIGTLFFAAGLLVASIRSCNPYPAMLLVILGLYGCVWSAPIIRRHCDVVELEHSSTIELLYGFLGFTIAMYGLYLTAFVRMIVPSKPTNQLLLGLEALVVGFVMVVDAACMPGCFMWKYPWYRAVKTPYELAGMAFFVVGALQLTVSVASTSGRHARSYREFILRRPREVSSWQPFEHDGNQPFVQV